MDETGHNHLQLVRLRRGLRLDELARLSGVPSKFVLMLERDELFDSNGGSQLAKSLASPGATTEQTMQRWLYAWAERLHQLADVLEAEFVAVFPDDYLADLTDRMWDALYAIQKLRIVLQTRSAIFDYAYPQPQPNPYRGWGWLRSEPLQANLADEASSLWPESFFEQWTLRSDLGTLLAGLPPHEARVLQLRYGLIDGQARTLEAVGQRLGITCERVRQIEMQAFRKLRHPKCANVLRPYLNLEGRLYDYSWPDRDRERGEPDADRIRRMGCASHVKTWNVSDCSR